MSFLNLSVLAYGALFIGVPVLLHLLMRRKPKHAMFPALRFVKQLQQSNQQRLRWRNLLLLVLRCLAVLGCAAAFSRPTVASELLGNWLLFGGLGLLSIITLIATWIAFVGNRRLMGRVFGGLTLVLLLCMAWIYCGIRGDGAGRLIGQEESPVAAVMIYDTSPRMLYRKQNQTRLKAASELGQWLLTQLPANSEIAVMDANAPSAVFSINRDAARRVIGALAVHHRSQPFAQSLSSALRLLDSTRKKRKEIYLLTDLTQQSWGTAPDAQVRSALAADPNLQIYVLDVGAEKPTNTALAESKLSDEFLSHGSPLRLETRIDRTGKAEVQTVELLLEKPDRSRPMIVDGKPLLPELTLRDQQNVRLESNGSKWVAFSINALEPGTHHGQIRLVGEDALTIDNVRYFTVEVADPWPVLVAAPRSAVPRFLTAALAPYEEQEAELSVFRCDTVDLDQLPNVRLEDYAVIALLDPTAENSHLWQSLADFASRGGSVAIFLGRNAHPIRQFNESEGGRLLPGALVREWRAGAQDIYVSMRDMSHPMLRAFRTINVPWIDFPVFRHWALDDSIPDATAIVRFGNGKPAIYERRLGNGRVLVMTTPISDPLNNPERPEWNRLATGQNSWPFFVLVHEMFKYLVRDSDARLNYQVGQTAQAATPGTLDTVRYQVFVPTGSWQDVTASNGQLTIPFTDQPGAYRLRRATTAEGQRGFAVNLSGSATNLARMDKDSLSAFLGVDSFRIAREREELHRDLGESRVGSELYPWLMVFVVMALAMEYVLANRFYAEGVRGTA